jgi:hypothetical protein
MSPHRAIESAYSRPRPDLQPAALAAEVCIASLAMSLRHARLAPDKQREAVAILNDKPLLALMMRLAWSGAHECRGLSATS